MPGFLAGSGWIEPDGWGVRGRSATWVALGRAWTSRAWLQMELLATRRSTHVVPGALKPAAGPTLRPPTPFRTRPLLTGADAGPAAPWRGPRSGESFGSSRPP